MIALVALSGFANINVGDNSVSSQNLIDSSGNALTGDLSLKKIKKAVTAPIKKVEAEVKRVETKVSAEAKRVEEKFTGPVKAIQQLAKQLTSIDCGGKFEACFLTYLLLGNNVKAVFKKYDYKTNQPSAEFSIEVKGEGIREENRIDIITSQKLNFFDTNKYLQRFDEREKTMTLEERECFGVFKAGVGASMKKFENKAFDCKFNYNQLKALKSEKDVSSFIGQAIRNSLEAEKQSLTSPTDLLGFIKFRAKQNAPCKGPLFDSIVNLFYDFVSITKTSIDSQQCKKIVADKKRKLLEELMKQQNVLDYLTI